MKGCSSLIRLLTLRKTEGGSKLSELLKRPLRSPAFRSEFEIALAPLHRREALTPSPAALLCWIGCRVTKPRMAADFLEDND